MTYLRTTKLAIASGVYIVAGRPVPFSGGEYTIVDLWTQGNEVVEYELKSPNGSVKSIGAQELEAIINKQSKIKTL